MMIAAALIFLPLREVQVEIDPVTGSMRRQTTWLGFLSTGPQIEVSPLETRLRESGIAWTPSWRFMYCTTDDVMGRKYACRSAPPIYTLASNRPAMHDFVRNSTDDDLRQFVVTMQSGDRPAQHVAIDAAFQKLLADIIARQNR
ncbi:MAG: hypothetical protein GC162_19065 [Planctomycetes bacterium]|nr:hypothetical protein [Planctomycetota bacterium]